MTDQPLVSVIIATYNSSSTLKYSVQSVLNQNYSNFEVIVIGDGCTDDSEEVLKSLNDERIQWFNLPVNSGSQPAPNNEGLRRSKGEYITFLGHDDLYLPNHLKYQLERIREENLEFNFSSMIYLGPEGVEYVRGKAFIDLDYSEFMAHPSSWIFSRALPQKAGYWNEDYWNEKFAPDVAQFKRFMKYVNYKVKPLEKVTAIKFPAGIWKLYKRDNDAFNPTRHYYQKMIENHTDLEIELLNKIVFKYSSNQYKPAVSFKTALSMVAIFYRKKLSTFLLELPFLSGYLKTRYLNKRKKMMRGRGLPVDSTRR